ncbi:MAG: exodeoxyribonuclease VII small subunit [Pelistega sp.]|nr:exodeoxyribonuclease VII small subunit [Pelistega sp.]
MAKASAKLPNTFEEALEELEGIVQGMEHDMLSLEDSLKAYERGVLLSKVCQEKLDAANQQIQVLQNNLLQPLNQSVGADSDDEFVSDDEFISDDDSLPF